MLVKLTQNADIDKYKYSGYVLGFDTRASLSLSDGSGFGKNITIFGVDMSSSVHIDNKKKDILILAKGSTDRLDNFHLNNRERVFNQYYGAKEEIFSKLALQ